MVACHRTLKGLGRNKRKNSKYKIIDQQIYSGAARLSLVRLVVVSLFPELSGRTYDFNYAVLCWGVCMEILGN